MQVKFLKGIKLLNSFFHFHFENNKQTSNHFVRSLRKDFRLSHSHKNKENAHEVGNGNFLLTHLFPNTFGAADHNFPKWCCGSGCAPLKPAATSPGDDVRSDSLKRKESVQNALLSNKFD